VLPQEPPLISLIGGDPLLVHLWLIGAEVDCQPTSSCSPYPGQNKKAGLASTSAHETRRICEMMAVCYSILSPRVCEVKALCHPRSCRRGTA
jgi:hypothetical protein